MARILVIDDEQYIGWVIKKAFEASDHEVSLCLDGKAGLDEIKRKSYDIVFLDLRLPDCDGMDMLMELKKIQRDISVIIITAHGSIDTAIESMKKGAFDYVTKPFDVDELILLAEKAMDKRQMEEEISYLRNEATKKVKEWQFSSKNPELNAVYQSLNKIAASSATVLITGESGTGKQLLARRIHQLSNRAKEPFVVFNCGGASDELSEIELFGYEKELPGGERERKTGLLELARNGTLLLDDINKADSKLQLKLAKVLTDMEIRRVGGQNDIKLDVRIIASTNEELSNAVRKASFREDLYYKLNVIPINLPPLRDRKEDISDLVAYLLKKYDTTGKIQGITPEAMKLLKNYQWYGNIRELENVIERIVILNDDPYIRSSSLPLELLNKRKGSGSGAIIHFPEEGINLEEVEKELILKALNMTQQNQSRAAQLLGITRSALIYRMQKYKL